MKVVNQIKAAAALGLMFLGTAVFAQDDAVYKKQTVTDNSDGTYTLELASFLKGDEVTVLKESSADIVLLLDYTGTMLGTVRVPHYFRDTSPYGEDYTYSTINTLSRHFGTGTTRPTKTLYYFYEGEYYPVKNRTQSSVRQLYIEPASGPVLYLSGTSHSPTAPDVRDNNTPIYSGELAVGYTLADITNDIYYLYDGEYYQVKKSATSGKYAAWIETPDGILYLNGDSLEPDYDHSVRNTSTVIYYGHLYKLRSTILRKEAQILAVLDFIESVYNYSYFDKEGNVRDTPLDNRIGLIAFTDNADEILPITLVTPQSQLEMKKIIYNYYKDGSTNHSKAINLANTMFTTESSPDRIRRALEVSDFASNAGSTAAKNAATALKDTGVEFYTFVVVPQDASSVGRARELSSREDYVFEAADYQDEFFTIFRSITEELTHVPANTEMDATTIVRDVISPHFIIPSGGQITAFTANVYKSGDDYTFGELEELDAATIYTEENADNGTTSVFVSGFDFSDNWVDISSSESPLPGKALLLRINIVPSESTIGGSSVPTTMDYSDIQLNDGTSVTNIPVPNVAIPITLTIVKTGLRKGESAVFIVSRKGSEEPDANYEEFTRFMLTGNASGSDRSAVLKNLDPAFVYQVKESGWSWQYTAGTGPVSTDDPTMSNPIIFSNTRKESAVHSAEAKVTNDFSNPPVVTTIKSKE